MSFNPRRQRFIEEMAVDDNMTQAAIRAGYSKKTAAQQASRLFRDVKIKAAIEEQRRQRVLQHGMSADDIVKRWTQIALADPNELVSVVVGSCRYCHGQGHQYQWRDEKEFDDAQEAHFALPDDKRDPKRAPVLGGGFGYRFRRQPNIDCPQCDGFGKRRVELRDTTELAPQAAALYAGAKQTMAGVEVKMHDQSAALERIAKHLGMFVDRVEHSGKMEVIIEGRDADL